MTFVFNRNFDDERNQENGKAPKVCPCDKLTQEEIDVLIEKAKAQAFQAGLDEGYYNALESLYNESDKTERDALAEIRAQLHVLVGKIDHHHAALEAQVLDFSLSICEQVFPYLQHSQSHERALTQIQKTMRLALNSPYINIMLSPKALPKLTPHIEQLANELGLSEQIQLSTDQNLTDGAAHVDWQNGFMAYSFDTVCERILSALKAAQSSTSNPLINGSDDNV